MVRLSLKFVSSKVACLKVSGFLAAVGLGLLTLTLPNQASAGWPHHARQVGLWHTPISSVGQCYPRPMISHPAPYRCNSGFYVRRDACDYRWSFSSNRFCAPRTWGYSYRSYYDCAPICLPYYPAYYCPPAYYYGAYPVWYGNGIFFGVANSRPIAPNPIQGLPIQGLVRNGARELDLLAIDAPRSTIAGNSLEDRLAQTRAILSKTYGGNANISNISRSAITANRSDLVTATNRLSQFRRDAASPLPTTTARSATRTTAGSPTSKMFDGDMAFAKGHYHTAEIYYRQAGRDSIELKKDAAIRLACSQFARGDYLKAAQTFRWVNEQETIIEKNYQSIKGANPVVYQWKMGLPKQQLAELFANQFALEQHLNRLADQALQKESNDTELWLLGVLMGLDGDHKKSELFLTRASQSTGAFATTAKFLVDSGRDQMRLQLAAQSLRSP